jgi:hypothetical protein
MNLLLAMDAWEITESYGRGLTLPWLVAIYTGLATTVVAGTYLGIRGSRLLRPHPRMGASAGIAAGITAILILLAVRYALALVVIHWLQGRVADVAAILLMPLFDPTCVWILSMAAGMGCAFTTGRWLASKQFGNPPPDQWHPPDTKEVEHIVG